MPTFHVQDFTLGCGKVLPELDVEYVSYGELAGTRDNVVLVTHGITSTHHAAGTVTPDRRKGWWDEAIGPGKLFDTDRYCVISSNMIGSSYGSTGPGSINPASGRPYGPSFPDVDVEDMVHAQHAMLRSLGIGHLLAVAGQSVGGFLAFQWAVSYPDFMAAVITTESGPGNLFFTDASLASLVDELAQDPHWNGGDYYDAGGLEETMTRLRARTLRGYGFEDRFTELSREDRESLLLQTAREWAREFDANSLVTLNKALARFGVESDLARIRAKLLLVLTDTDELYPAAMGQEMISRLLAAGVDAALLEVESELGHYATVEEPQKWIPAASQFLRGLACTSRSRSRRGSDGPATGKS